LFTQIVDVFERFCQATSNLDALKKGVTVTPLPEPEKPKYFTELD